MTAYELKRSFAATGEAACLGAVWAHAVFDEIQAEPGEDAESYRRRLLAALDRPPKVETANPLAWLYGVDWIRGLLDENIRVEPGSNPPQSFM